LLGFLLAVVKAASSAPGSWEDRPESELVDALIARDPGAFNWLVRKYWKSMHRVASGLLRTETVASEVVQETWEIVLKEIDGFRREASLKNWMFRILVNKAKRTGKREARSIPFSQLLTRDARENDSDPSDEFTSGQRWRSTVHAWSHLDPQQQTINNEGLRLLAGFLEDLPESQKVVVTLRDVENLGSAEVCDILDISEANQRVLLHRGRTALRRALEKAERGRT